MESTSSSHSSNVNSMMSAINKDEKNPLWRYVTKIERLGVGGGNCKWVCNFCNQEKQGTYTRVRAHLLQITGNGISTCKEVGMDSISEMRKMEGILAQEAFSSQPKKVSLPSTTRNPLSQPSGSSILKKRRIPDTHISRISDLQTRDQLDAEIARMFYTAGLPFNVARNPYYISSFKFAADHSLSGYVPPSYDKLRTTLLQQEKTRLERLLEPIKSTWFEKGVSIITNGWSDPQRRHPINIMTVSDSGPMFMKSVDCFGEIKDKHFIANLLKEVINEIGDQKVVQIITDNAINCKAAGEIIEGMFPDIYWTPCIVQALDLALKNICAAKNVETNQVAYDLCNWINIVHGDALQIKHFVMSHSMRLAMYNRFSSLKLLSVADTRFASIIVTLKRFKLIRRALEAMVLSEQWAQYREDDQEKARFVRKLVLNEDWWEKVNYILAFTAPIYEMLRACDTDKPCLHLVHERWDSMIEMVKKVIYEHERKQLNEYSAFYDVVHEILGDCWAKSNSPLHCLAHSLSPR